MFLKHLQRKTERTIDGQASGTVITGSDGVTKGQVVFSSYEDVEASSSLRMGHSCQLDMLDTIQRSVPLNSMTVITRIT